MDALLQPLDADSLVLDLGSGQGSFPYERVAARVVALDQDLRLANAGQTQARIATGRCAYVFGGADGIPLRSGTVDLVVANHIFEHVERPAVVAAEIGRVLKPNGVAFVSVPDGFSLSDGLYRGLSRVPDHIQRFTLNRLQEAIEANSDLELLHTYRLYSSFSYLKPLKWHEAFGLRNKTLAAIPKPVVCLALGALNVSTRTIDAVLDTQTSLYGWACYFGKPRTLLQSAHFEENINVCSSCGSGHSAAWLAENAGRMLQRTLGFQTYRCAVCGWLNPYFPPCFAERILKAGPRDEKDGELEKSRGAGLPDCADEDRTTGAGEDRAGDWPVISRLVDATSGLPCLSPGSLVAVEGVNLSQSNCSAESMPWPIEFAGTQLMVNGRPARLSHVSANRIIAHIPPDEARGPAEFSVLSCGRLGPAVRLSLTLTAPALLAERERPEMARADDADGRAIDEQNPARAGALLRLYATGLGPVVPLAYAGHASPENPLARTLRSPLVRFGELPATVEECALEPGSVGVYRIDVQVPARMKPGAARVCLAIGGRRAPALSIPIGR
jgi:uncharacterized protein (TIGR03437 family)